MQLVQLQVFSAAESQQKTAFVLMMNQNTYHTYLKDYNCFSGPIFFFIPNSPGRIRYMFASIFLSLAFQHFANFHLYRDGLESFLVPLGVLTS